MTQLAHDCVLLGIPFDPIWLYEKDDPNYELWLWGLIERVAETKREQAEKAKRG